MPKRPLQIGRSTFTPRTREGAWWVLEEYDLMGHNRSRDEREEWHGPYSEAGARANASAWTEEEKR